MANENRMDKIDRNFKIESSFTQEDLIWLDVRDEPFTVYGLYDYKNQRPFIRLPYSVAKNTSEGVAYLNFHTAGGRVRFATDSPFIAIKAYIPDYALMSHMTVLATLGFDLEETVNGKTGHVFSYQPPVGTKNEYEGIYRPGKTALHDYTINFPLYNGVNSLYIGISKNAVLQKHTQPYRNALPAVFYGSSITQGGCASRPGNSYQGFLARMLNLNYTNLGFSGNGKGEDAITQYMAGLPMSMFISDYDHNAPSLEHLQRTCANMYQVIRQKNPMLPYVFVSKPDMWGDEASAARRDGIRKIYEDAVAAGDKRVWYIDGETLFETDCRDDCTVDRCHPNDLGFYRMACAMRPVLENILKLIEK